MRVKLILCFMMFLWVGVAGPGEANERKFAYTYESGTMPAGTRELEFWATWREGRANFYSAFDYRTEFEFGVTDRLLASLYLNWHRETLADPANPSQKIDNQEFEGISSEWKYKLLDPVADPVGLALYQEYTVHTDEFEWESKLILDKKMGDVLAAYNAVVEPDWEFGPDNTEYALNLENDLGLTYFFTSAFSAGLEARNTNQKDRTSPGLRNSTLFVGPVVSYARNEWYITATFLRQLPAIKRSVDNPQDNLVLDTHEKTNIRILVSTRF